MLSVREKAIHRAVQMRDPELRYKRWGDAGVIYKVKCYFPRQDSIIIALTDNWNISGAPVQWTSGAVLNRLRQIDQAQGGITFEEIDARREAEKRSKERAFQSDLEARLYDLRSSFAKATNDVNTSTLEKIDKRRIHDGYRK